MQDIAGRFPRASIFLGKIHDALSNTAALLQTDCLRSLRRQLVSHLAMAELGKRQAAAATVILTILRKKNASMVGGFGRGLLEGMLLVFAIT